MKLRIVAAVCVLALPVSADEGLWLFNEFPANTIKETHHFELPAGFLDHLRLATVSIGAGSGAFVSPQGLLVTNQHLIADCLSQAGAKVHDYLTDGFYAATATDEAPCTGLSASVLTKLEDVTAQVKGGGTDGLKPGEALERRSTGVSLEKSCAAKTGHACAVVKLFSGERYDLYEYKKYTDLRLVFAPERALAFFGGNPDSLAYPRYLFDVAFLRAYENGQPAATPQFLKWSQEGAGEDELVFSSGSPQATARLATVAQLNFYRDAALPFTLFRLQQRIQDLRASAANSAGRGATSSATASELLLTGLGNDYKWTAGKLIGLKDDWLMARKTNFEKRLRAAVQSDAKLGPAAGKVWDDIATAYRNWTPFEKRYQTLESPGAVGSTLFRMARQIVRGEEAPLEAAVPLDDGVETAMLARYLEDLKSLGDKETPLKAILGGKTPQQAAEEMVRGTRLKEATGRAQLRAARSAEPMANDPLIRLAQQLEEPARKVARKHSEMIEALDASATDRIAHYRYRVFGASEYPDATGTPRVSFGVVKGYRDRADAPTPYTTTFSGLYYLAASKSANYQLPPRWVAGRDQLDPLVSMDFVSTCDVTASAAGSPVMNRNGELVGVTFEGNLESIANTYLYLDDRARALHASTRAVSEALKRLYHTKRLLDELGM